MILCSMIAANKISPDGSGNYGLRSSLARKLVSDDFRVFGNLWNVSIAKKVRYRLAVLKFNLQSGLFVNPVNIFSGIFTKFDESIQSVPNKHTVIEQSKFSLVIENSNDYLSEKLIDALIGGSIPIFLGPNLNNTPIPNHCVFRLPANPNDLTQFLKELDPLLIQSKLANIKSFLESDDFLEWDSMRIYRNIASIVNDKLEASKNLW